MDFSKLITETGSTLENVALAIALGAIIACLYILFEKKHMGKIVRKLISLEAYSPDKAQTLEQMGLAKSPFLRHALKNETSALSRIIKHEGDEPLNKKNLPETKFWLDEDKKDIAEKRFSTHNSNILLVIVTAVIVLVLAYLLIKYIPLLLEFNPFGE